MIAKIYMNNIVCQRLKENKNKSKVMVFKQEKHGLIEFTTTYSARAECKKRCRIKLSEQIMEER